MKLLWNRASLRLHWTMFLVGTVGSIFFSSCKKEEFDYGVLFVENQIYYVPLGKSTPIMIKRGSGDFEFIPADKSMISVTFQDDRFYSGAARTVGLKKGYTTMKIRDKKTNKETEVQIQVVNPYLYFEFKDVFAEIEGNVQIDYQSMQQAIQKYAHIRPGIHMVLQKNQTNDFYSFDSQYTLPVGGVKERGKFDFELDGPFSSQLFLEFDHENSPLTLPLSFDYNGSFDYLIDFVAPNSKLKLNASLPGNMKGRPILAHPGPNPTDVIGKIPIEIPEEFWPDYPEVKKAKVYQFFSIYPPQLNAIKIGSKILED